MVGKKTPAAAAATPDWFDADAYLLANPDVAKSVAAGAFESAFDHYMRHGRDERRPLRGASREPHNRLIRTLRGASDGALSGDIRASLEVLMLSNSGGMLLVGWVDDSVAPLEWITVSGAGWYLTFSDSRVARFRRTDVEAALGTTRQHAFGFFCFAYTAETFDAGGTCKGLLRLVDGRELSLEIPARRISDIELRNTVLTYVAHSEVFGNRQVEAVRMLRAPVRNAVVEHNRAISKQIVSGAYVEHFGLKPRKLRGSMIVCLYGKAEYLFLQNALYAGGAGFEDYEIIYVSNSPEIAEQLMKDVRSCNTVYGIPQTLVLLPGNAGFGAANNVAVNYALSERILIVNPDVFPRDADWARKHSQAVSELPKAQTELFGVSLYYDDGTLMHGGMYFEFDTGVSVDAKGMATQRLVRVEHYGKGAPAWSDRFTHSRPVPAVTGAFMSASRSWYEKLGGFTEDYVFGHYEDADLCLKSIKAGVAPWLHDIKLWHLEGKGSTRLPVHEGGSYVNRALFSERWDEMIAANLEGPHPSHPLLQLPAEAVPAVAMKPAAAAAIRISR